MQEDQSRLISTSGAEKVKVCKIQHALQHLQRDEASVLVCKPMLTLPFLDNLSCAHAGGIRRGGSTAEGAWLFFYN